MAGDIAQLGYQIDSSGLVAGTKALDDHAKAAERAGAAADDLNKAEQGAANSTHYAAEQARVLAAQNKAMSQTTRDVVAQQVAAAKAAAQQSINMEKLLGSIDPTLKKLGQLDTLESQLAKAKSLGLIGGDDFADYSAKLDAMRKSAVNAANGVHSISLESSLARRELGRLAGDVASGNWGRFEQTSLTLANYTGLMGVAFSGAGIAILGTAAALGVLAKAAYDGYEELNKLHNITIANANAAGVTGDTLDKMASDVGDATGKFADSRKAIELLAGSGQFRGQGLSSLAESAVNMSTVTGQSIEQVVAEFVKLEGDPSKAISDLNDKYNVLTGAQYAQIAALQEMGQTDKAAELAQNDLSSAMDSRAKAVQENSGFLVQLAQDVSKAWDGAWDAIKGIGKQSSLQEQIDAARAALADAETPQIGADGSLYSSVNSNEVKNKLANLQNLLAQSSVADAMARDQSIIDEVNKASISAQNSLSQHMTAEQKLSSQIAKADKAYQDAINTIGLTAADKAKLKAQHDQWVDDANRSYDKQIDKTFANKNKVTTTPIDGYLKQLRDENLLLNANTNATTSLTDADKFMLKIRSDIANDPKLTSADKTRLDALLDQTQATVDLYDKTLKQKALQEALDRQNAAFAAQDKARAQSNDNEIYAIGHGSDDAEQNQRKIRLANEYADELKRLGSREVAQDKDQWDVQTANAQAHYAQALSDEDAFQARRKAAMGDWLNGADKAYADYLHNASDVASQTNTLFTDAFSGMEDALVTFVSTGKLSFKSLADSIIADMARMVIKQQESTLLTSLFGGLLGSSAYGSNTTGQGVLTSLLGSASSYGGGSSWSGLFNAKGGVYDSPSLSAYSGSIVNKPTMFAFARGAGVMGEAGPEAILPLKRGAGGSLGVVAQSAQPVVNVNIHKDADEDRVDTTTNGGGLNIDVYVKATAKKAVMEMVQGGALKQFGVVNRGVSRG